MEIHKRSHLNCGQLGGRSGDAEPCAVDKEIDGKAKFGDPLEEPMM